MTASVLPFGLTPEIDADTPLPEWDGSLALWDALFPVRFAFSHGDEAREEGRADVLLFIDPFFTTDMEALANLLRPLLHGQPSLIERWEGEPATLARLQAEPLTVSAYRMQTAHRLLADKLGCATHDEQLVAALTLRLTPGEGGVT